MHRLMTRAEGEAPTRQRADGSGPVRRHLWVAMLGLALVPTVAGVVVTASLLSRPQPEEPIDRTSAAAAAAATLQGHEKRIASRLGDVADDPALARLTNGIRGAAEQELARDAFRKLQGPDGGIVTSACVVRSSDGLSTALPGHPPTSLCARAAIGRLAASVPADRVTRALAKVADDGHRLVLATPIQGTSARNAGALAVEVDVAALLDRSGLAGSEASTSMLVDMATSALVAASPTQADAPGSAGWRTQRAIASSIDGILASSTESAEELASMGMSSTVVPVWGATGGTRLGLVQIWPAGPTGSPGELPIALMALVVGAIVAAIALVRYFLEPFEELADSKAQLQVLYREAREEALNDGLTGLGNHRAFQEELNRQMAAWERRGAPFSLALMDLDDLKLVNDRDGHAAGDDMLLSMAQTMRDMARRDDRLYRVGGDEFAMIMPNTDVESAVSAAERILHFCKRPPSGARPSPFSCGISTVPTFTRDRDMLNRQADAALYWAKRHGRGSVEVFEAERDQLPDEHTDIAGQAVQEVVTGKLLTPVFQPIVDLRTGRVLGFEGLIRPDPKGPLPDTGRLFAAAAASGRTVELDLACIEVVIKGARAIGSDQLLTLNLSPRTLEVKDFDPAWLLSGLVRNGISPSRVIVEVTERDEVDDMGRLQKTFRLLQQYGLRLAADDVGAGNAGLRLLSKVQFDIVKIDLSLVHDGVRRLGSRAVLQSLRDLALSQDARIVAEGVETPQQLQVIRELSIGAGQGYLLGRPDAAVTTTFVDVRQLESGILVPAHIANASGLAARLEAVAHDRRRGDVKEDPAEAEEQRATRPMLVLPGNAGRRMSAPEPGAA